MLNLIVKRYQLFIISSLIQFLNTIFGIRFYKTTQTLFYFKFTIKLHQSNHRLAWTGLLFNANSSSHQLWIVKLQFVNQTSLMEKLVFSIERASIRKDLKHLIVNTTNCQVLSDALELNRLFSVSNKLLGEL